jgi:hypothetical protein
VALAVVIGLRCVYLQRSVSLDGIYVKESGVDTKGVQGGVRRIRVRHG